MSRLNITLRPKPDHDTAFITTPDGHVLVMKITSVDRNNVRVTFEGDKEQFIVKRRSQPAPLTTESPADKTPERRTAKVT